MSDFDEVLERLVTDPGFQAALWADPAAALRGYRLESDEIQLLHAQLDLADGGDRTVEDRVTKSGLVGMVGPVISALGLLETPVQGSPDPGAGTHPLAAGALGGQPAEGVAVFGVAPEAGEVELSFGGAAPEGAAVFGVVQEQGTGLPAVGYETVVDADGDGEWDAHVAVEGADGGVDILVDRDGDGVVDWVAHDYDRDGLIESADVDTDSDGVLDTRYVDQTGDGWLDREVPFPTGNPGTFGVATPGQS